MNSISNLRLIRFYERHRKMINDNTGLIIAFLAAGAAIYSGWVAEKARRDASDIANNSIALQGQSLREQRNEATESLRIQERSVAAQIEATRLDERSYLLVSYDHIELCPEKCNGDDAYIKVKVSGRTPALDVRFDIECTELNQPIRKTLKMTPDSATLGILPVDDQLVPHSAYCKKNPKQEGYTEAWLYGVVEYKDIFNISHSTEFCFELTPTKEHPNDWDACTHFSSKLT